MEKTLLVLIFISLSAQAAWPNDDKKKDGQHQEQRQNQIQGQELIQVDNSSTEQSNSQSVTFEAAKIPDNTPSVFAPNASPTSPCRVAWSGGGAIPGFGITAGSSVLDEGCDLRERIRTFQNLGMHKVAAAIACEKLLEGVSGVSREKCDEDARSARETIHREQSVTRQELEESQKRLLQKVMEK